jgi:hypothetical protein
MTLRPGHKAALKHGATSARTVNPLVEELIAVTIEQAPFLAQPSFKSALEAWTRAETRCQLLENYLDEHGLLDADGNPRPAAAFATQQENLALKHRTRLGLDAASRAGIEASLTSTAASQASLEAALEKGAQLLRERMAGAGSAPEAHQERPGQPLGSPDHPGGQTASGSGSGAPE